MRNFRNNTRVLASVLIALATTVATACGDDPTEPIEGGGDPENISRVTVTLVPGSGATQTSFRVDPDGTTLPLPVGAAQGTLALIKGQTYSGEVKLLNDLDPRNVIDITNEVRSEANFHRFFYTLTCAGVTVPVASLDKDTQTPVAQPLGIKFQLLVSSTAATSSACTLRVELRHFENAKGDGTGSVFDTDLAIEFPVTVN
ncbi:MAG: hypothetical protein H7Z40_21015 [Phycisphaerae bacterium]|nr:hypothetical protein [Gemmatimonadaceae bacterium]